MLILSVSVKVWARLLIFRTSMLHQDILDSIITLWQNFEKTLFYSTELCLALSKVYKDKVCEFREEERDRHAANLDLNPIKHLLH